MKKSKVINHFSSSIKMTDPKRYKRLSIKDVRSQRSGACPVQAFCRRREKGFFVCTF